MKMRSVGDYPPTDPSAYKINNRQQNLSATDLASNNENLVSAPCRTASPEVMKIRCVVTSSSEGSSQLQAGQQSALNQNFKKYTN
ncbi:MAG: hypothetical protein WCF46_09640 [Nitrososphaeraceae archaeon]